MKKTKKIIAIIPARMASTRFPGKALANIMGLPMIEHVRRRVSLCKGLSDVIVATCDKDIKEAVEKHGGKVIMTSDKHERCTDRIAEAAESLDADVIVNVQGDEPLVMPQMISQVYQPMLDDAACKCVNLVSPIDSDEEFENPNVVKTVIDLKGNILYFSREPIPSRKKAQGSFKRYKQVGIIAFTKEALSLYGGLKQSPLEKTESVDMLRFLENGYPIKAVIARGASYGVDTPDELKRVKSMMKQDALAKQYI